MAAGGAASAVFGFRKPYWELPISESGLYGDHFRERASMNVVANNTTPAFVLPVNMNIMKVLVAVPEAGRKRRLGIKKHVPVMAGEAEFILLVGVRDIHFH